jgi:hypothetical protein
MNLLRAAVQTISDLLKQLVARLLASSTLLQDDHLFQFLRVRCKEQINGNIFGLQSSLFKKTELFVFS